MSGITKKAFLAIQQVVRHAKCDVSLGITWSDIHTEWHVGEIRGKRLFFSAEDREKLRSIAILAAGRDPMDEDIQGSRVEVAATVIDEKWSNESPFKDMVYVCSRELPVKEGKIEIPSGTMFFIDIEQIDINSINSVIIIENAAAARFWQQYEITIPNGLAIYRGHDQSAVAVKKLMNQLPSHVRKIGFFDLDPAGFNIALSSGVEYLLLPEDKDGLLPGNRESFIKQYAKYSGIEKRLPEKWIDSWTWVVRQGECITQEKMLAKGARIRLV